MKLHKKECQIAGLDPKVIEKLGKRLAKVCKEAEELGIEVFGAEGSCAYLIANKVLHPESEEPLVLFNTNQPANGGLCQSRVHEDGLHSLCG